MEPISTSLFIFSNDAEARMPAATARPAAAPPPVEPFPYANVRSAPSTAPVDSPSGSALFRPGQSTALPIPFITYRPDGKSVSFESPLSLADVLKLIPFETVERLTLLRYLPTETKLVIPDSVYKNAWNQYLELHSEPFSWQRPEVQWIYLSLALDEYLVTRTNDLAQALSSYPSYYTLHDYSIDYRNDPLFLNSEQSPENLLMQNTPLWRVNKEAWVENKRANEILRRVRKGELNVEDLLRDGVMITGGEAAVEEMIAERRKADVGFWFNFLAQMARGVGNEASATWLEGLAKKTAPLNKNGFQEFLSPVASTDKRGNETQQTLGNAIRLARIKKGMTQGELAKMVKTHGSYISNFETGRAEPSPNLRRKLERALELPAGYLDQMAPTPKPSSVKHAAMPTSSPENDPPRLSGIEYFRVPTILWRQWHENQNIRALYSDRDFWGEDALKAGFSVPVLLPDPSKVGLEGYRLYETEQLRRAIKNAFDGGEPAVIVVAGPEGAGKSTVIRRVIQELVGVRVDTESTTHSLPGSRIREDATYILNKKIRIVEKSVSDYPDAAVLFYPKPLSLKQLEQIISHRSPAPLTWLHIDIRIVWFLSGDPRAHDIVLTKRDYHYQRDPMDEIEVRVEKDPISYRLLQLRSGSISDYYEESESKIMLVEDEPVYSKAQYWFRLWDVVRRSETLDEAEDETEVALAVYRLRYWKDLKGTGLRWGYNSPVFAVNGMRVTQLFEIYWRQNRDLSPYTDKRDALELLINDFSKENHLTLSTVQVFTNPAHVEPFLLWLESRIDEANLTPQEQRIIKYVMRQPGFVFINEDLP